MGYRLNDKPIKPEDMLHRFDVRNGATMKIAFQCYYWIPEPGHDPHYHDYINWPAPNYHGDACQMKPPRDLIPGLPRPIMRTDQDLKPIHLLDEGYSEAVITFDDPDVSQYLETEATIDPDDDCIVRVLVETNFPTFKDKPIDTRFTVFVKKDTNGIEIRDAVCHGILTVLPGSPYYA